jgi:hypothetical protein
VLAPTRAPEALPCSCRHQKLTHTHARHILQHRYRRARDKINEAKTMSSEALRQRLAREAQEEAARVAEEKKKRREEVGVHKLNDLFTLLFVLSLQNSQSPV